MHEQMTIKIVVVVALFLCLSWSCTNCRADSTICNFDEKVFVLSPGESYFPLECTISPFNEIHFNLDMVGRGATLFFLTSSQKQDYLSKVKDDIYYMPKFNNFIQSFVLDNEQTTSISLTSTKRMDGIDKIFILMKEDKFYTVESSVSVRLLITPQQAPDTTNAGSIVGAVLGTFTILGLCIIVGVIGGAILWKKKVFNKLLLKYGGGVGVGGSGEYETVL